MQPEEALKYICGAMSLHAPQERSLRLFADYLQSPAGQLLLGRMKKEARGNLTQVLETTREYFGAIPEAGEFTSFERAFPAYTFALATGVGKTRLMGAFVTYLYLVYNVQHFLIVAPNLTIYRKLYEDFSKANNSKYVFRGIQEININTTKVITTENYASQHGSTLFGNKIEINIFNIQQFAQKDMTSERGITKAWEAAGESYFDYLKAQDDLVVMLDEAHHYHADAALGAFDLMDPLFGLEFTATPYLGTKGSGKKAQQIRMKNVLYTYNLGDAIRGKLVKDPWIGTEADVDFGQFDADSIETDARKLQLAAFFHERAKNALKEYALENNKPVVKPVLLVVAKDTEHAHALKLLIDSDSFRGGEFKGKVIEIHTKLRGDEADKNIEELISLEHPDNVVEVVIHVNMLKEGWDVTNVYTIAPLREAAAAILTEQTIGRGLRLPYGARTGVALVDRLVIVAHEQFSRVVELAKDSPLIQGQVEQITEAQTKEVKILTEVRPVVLENVAEAIRDNATIMQAVAERAEEQIAKLPNVAVLEPTVREKFVEAKREEIVGILSREAVEGIDSMSRSKGIAAPVGPFDPDTIFSSISPEAQEALSGIAKQTESTIETRNISIPRLMIIPHFAELVITDFDLDTNKLQPYTNERAVLEEQLQGEREQDLFGVDVPGRRKIQMTRVTSFGKHVRQTPESTIIAALLDCPLVDYDDPKQKPLLLKLAEQAVEHYRTRALDEENLALIVESNARSIAEDIYQQILTHKELKSDGYLEPEIGEPRRYAEQHNISVTLGEGVVTLDSQVDTFSHKLLYGHFKKACHPVYRFDRSSYEARLAFLLDRDDSVEDWMRPAPNQFEGLFWRDDAGEAHHRYEPDFVIELEDEIIMAEVKSTAEMHESSVLAKKATAEKYCEIVNKNIGKFGIAKPWRYVLIPTERISIQSTVENLLK